MKSFKLILLASALGLAALSTAQAADISTPQPEAPIVDTPEEYAALGWYLRGDIGWSFLEWSGGEDDSALTAGGGVGYKFNDNMRTDLRVDWAGDYNIGGGDDQSVTTVLGNMYFDWANESAFTPYVGAGAGYGWVNSDQDDDDGFAYALMAGVSVNLSENVAIDTGYRFRDVVVEGSDPYEHQITTGIRFGF